MKDQDKTAKELDLHSVNSIALETEVEASYLGRWIRLGRLPKPTHKHPGKKSARRYYNDDEAAEIVCRVVAWKRWRAKNPMGEQ